MTAITHPEGRTTCKRKAFQWLLLSKMSDNAHTFSAGNRTPYPGNVNVRGSGHRDRVLLSVIEVGGIAKYSSYFKFRLFILVLFASERRWANMYVSLTSTHTKCTLQSHY